jgi:hypothetical protein
MKVFWVLAWSTYYPCGELGNVHSAWSAREKAEEIAEAIKLDYDWVRVVDVSEILGIGDSND